VVHLTGASRSGAPVVFFPRALAAAIALASALACRRASPPVEWHAEAGYRWRALTARSSGGPGFALLPPTRTGIRFTNSVTLDSALWNRHLAQGGGVALGDVDGDGLPDIFLTSNQGANALYRNLGDWRFEDITASAGVAMTGRHSTGAVFADVDGDGTLDLLVSTLGGGVALFINDGHGRFTERTAEAGLGGHSGSMTMTLTDVDGDGHLDLYVANYKTRSAMDVYPPQERQFDQVVRDDGHHHYEVVPKFRNDYRVVDRPEYNLVSMQQRADPDGFYLNDGKGHFRLVSWTSGRFRDERGKPLTAAPEYFGLSAKFTDVDGDGAPDLYVCDDFEDPDMFWLNDGKGTFRAAPSLAVRNTSNSSMGVDFSDVDRDGNVDLLVVDMLGRGARRKTEVPTHTPLPKLVGQIADRPQWQRNTLLWNRGDGTFAQIGAYAGIEASDWSWGVVFLDVDLDGYEDALITTGHLWDVMDADTWERIRTTFTPADWRRELALFPKLAVKNVAFRNNGDLTFSDAGAAWGFADEPAISHGIATADLDGDGALDVVVNRLGSPAAVFRNLASAPRVAVRLRGRSPNTAGAGSKIRVLGGPVPVQQKEVVLGGEYLSGSDPLYTFAAGTAQELTIEVDWRRGGRTVIHGVKPNREYEINEPLPSSEAPVAAAPLRSPEPLAPWFRDVSAQLDHRHVETPFNDWARQPLLPQALSRLGPGVTWYDVDGDGMEDLLITSGRGGTLTYYRNDHGRLTRADLHVPPARYDETTVLPVPDGKGGTALLVGQSNYTSQTPSEAAAVPSVLEVTRGGGGQVTTAVPGDVVSAGPLAVADVDGDGDLDLFVGGRVAPGAYPGAVSSRLFRNDGGGRFVLEDANAGVFDNVGLISAAVFSDVNGDGWPDLILAPEWGSLKLFLNEHGRFHDATAEWGLDRVVGRWNGVTTGDLDGDGRLDIVATSWGRNTKYQVDATHPLFLYYGYFSGTRRWDMIEAQYDDRLHAVAPLAPFGQLTTTLPVARLTMRTAAAYANATLQQVLGGGTLQGAQRLEAATLDQQVFLNRGGKFEAQPLPPEAQFAPAFYAGVADFDGDGHEDVFLAQNFFPTELATPRYDAGRGLLLRGRGDGTLEPVPGQVSGILVYGDERGAAFADYDGDGRIDLVVSQNGAETKLYHNEHARPGVRVRLEGGSANPHAIGAVLRLVYDGSRGPAREVHGGSGYWSEDGAIQVLGVEEGKRPTAVSVRWPGAGARETIAPLTAGQWEITIRRPNP
jgi:enediyne biosynthesis protein E4